MNTSGLFIFITGPEIWLKAVHFLGPGGKKTEGIKVAAVERTRVNDGIDFFPWEAQGNCFAMTDFRAIVEHGPFMEPVTGEVRRPFGG